MTFPVPRLAVLLTCFNRKQNTLRCLASLYSQSYSSVSTDIFLVDDGSVDGTAAEVKSQFPEVHILQGNGSLFWNRGMHLAFNNSLVGRYDFYLWLNDDTYLYPDAFKSLFDSFLNLPEKARLSIIVGSTIDPDTNSISYGGYKKYSRWHPFKYALVSPHDHFVRSCDTMCGNCVLIPAAVVDLIGIINPVYQHRWGDVDYGLRAKKAGCKIFTAKGFVGECSFNHNSNVWESTSLSVSQRIKAINSIKGLQKEDWKYFTKVHGGILWFLYWLSPYMKIYLSIFSLQIKKAKKYAG